MGHRGRKGRDGDGWDDEGARRHRRKASARRPPPRPDPTPGWRRPKAGPKRPTERAAPASGSPGAGREPRRSVAPRSLPSVRADDTVAGALRAFGEYFGYTFDLPDAGSPKTRRPFETEQGLHLAPPECRARGIAVRVLDLHGLRAQQARSVLDFEGDLTVVYFGKGKQVLRTVFHECLRAHPSCRLAMESGETDEDESPGVGVVISASLHEVVRSAAAQRPAVAKEPRRSRGAHPEALPPTTPPRRPPPPRSTPRPLAGRERGEPIARPARRDVRSEPSEPFGATRTVRLAIGGVGVALAGLSLIVRGGPPVLLWVGLGLIVAVLLGSALGGLLGAAALVGLVGGLMGHWSAWIVLPLLLAAGVVCWLGGGERVGDGAWLGLVARRSAATDSTTCPRCGEPWGRGATRCWSRTCNEPPPGARQRVPSR